MSPRAAWRLEAAGFSRVHDYVAGKSDWLAADLPYEGDAELVGRFTRRDPPTVNVDQTVADAVAAHQRTGYGPVIVLNHADVVMGVARQPQLRGAPPSARVAEAMSSGVSTVRPSEQVADLVQRMHHLDTTRVVVTRSDGTLVGIFVADDVHIDAHHEH